MTAAGVRVPHARWIVLAAGVVLFAVLLWFTRTFTYYFDEWTFIATSPDWTFWSYFEPHNEHPTMLLKLTYTVLLNTVGLRSYVPYMAVLLIAHLANVMLLFELVRRRSGELIATAAALIFLLLGAGWEDLLWAFQIGWLVSMAFGLGAMIAVDSRRPALAAALLTVSLTFAGTGLVFVVAAVVQLLLTPGRRRELRWFAAPGVALVAWYVAFGRFGEHPNPQPTAANLLIDPLYTVWGLSQGIAGIIGTSGWIGYVLLAAAMAVLAWRWRVRGLDPFAIGIGAGLVSFFLVAGATRAQLGWQQSGASRYVYVAAAVDPFSCGRRPGPPVARHLATRPGRLRVPGCLQRRRFARRVHGRQDGPDAARPGRPASSRCRALRPLPRRVEQRRRAHHAGGQPAGLLPGGRPLRRPGRGHPGARQGRLLRRKGPSEEASLLTIPTLESSG